jgi:hypothetical protein
MVNAARQGTVFQGGPVSANFVWKGKVPFQQQIETAPAVLTAVGLMKPAAPHNVSGKGKPLAWRYLWVDNLGLTLALIL